jgi:hypothetical protein
LAIGGLRDARRQQVYTGGQQMGNPLSRVKSLAEI